MHSIPESSLDACTAFAMQHTYQDHPYLLGFDLFVSLHLIEIAAHGLYVFLEFFDLSAFVFVFVHDCAKLFLQLMALLRLFAVRRHLTEALSGRGQNNLQCA